MTLVARCGSPLPSSGQARLVPRAIVVPGAYRRIGDACTRALLVGLVAAGLLAACGSEDPESARPVTVCGNGVVEVGERCDDGAANSDAAPGACRTICVQAGCGDGVLDAGEACDAGSANSDSRPDACRTDCVAPSCGDGVVDSGETCDDGAANDDSIPDACRTDCWAAACGDGVVDAGEACDDGSANSDTRPDTCRTDCSPPSCGDGVTDAGEACDDGPGNSDVEPSACRTTCVAPVCGDGVVDSHEECDQGSTNSDALPDACRTSCHLAGCGDRIVDAGEVCDDGNDESRDGCDRCQVTRLEIPSPCATDGSLGVCVVNGGDATCWDPDGDGAGRCARLYEAGGACEPALSSAVCPMLMGCLPSEDGPRCQPTCGDGQFQRDFGERCDDGNLEPGDNCSPECRPVAGTCAEPANLDLGHSEGWGGYFAWSGNLEDHASQKAASCLPGTEANPDVVVRFTAPEAGTWTFEYDPFGFVGSITVLGADCAGGPGETCLSGSGELRVSRELSAGETVYLSLDGLEAKGFYLTAARPVCGDGVRQVFEECDDGNADAGDGCFACLAEGSRCEAPWPLDAAGTAWTGTVWPGMGPGVEESCAGGDWSSVVGRFVAPAAGRYVFRAQVPDSAAAFSVRGGACGAGAIELLCGALPPRIAEHFVIDLAAGETVYPTVAVRFRQTFSVEVLPLACGDGILAFTESCDDGNTADGDGCSAACTLES